MLEGNKEEREAWKVAPLPELVRFLVGTCHLQCRQDMALLETLLELEGLEAGLTTPSVIELRDLVAQFCKDMRAHLNLEERKLFPYILTLQGEILPVGAPEALASFKTLLGSDHEVEASHLRTLRVLASGLEEAGIPASAQGRIYEAMMKLSGNLQKHFYLENQILFPRLG